MNQQNLLSITSFNPNWLQTPNAWIGHLPFAAWIIKEMRPRIFVELGTHTGNSYFSFCQAVTENNLPTKCYAVDTWKGDEHAGHYDEDIYTTVNAYHQKQYTQFSRLLRMPFDEALSYFADKSIDLLHIDGLHTYEAVSHDFESWLPKLASGAVVLFHDTNVRERNFGVWRLWDELKNHYPHHIEFVHSHGLGVLQINPTEDVQPQEFLTLPSVKKQEFISFFASLGNHQLERFELNESLQKIQNLTKHSLSLEQTISEQINKIESISASLEQTISEQINKIESISALVADRDARITQLSNERDLANNNFLSVRSSTSWKLTAPIRFLGYLLKGDFQRAYNVIKKAFSFIINLFPQSLQKFIGDSCKHTASLFGIKAESNTNFAAIAAIIEQRNILTSQPLTKDPLIPPPPKVWPTIDISIVTYNSTRWISGFITSLIALDYPKHLLNLCFIDNNSSDSTLETLYKHISQLQDTGFNVAVIKRPNLGYGAGHNHAMSKGNSRFCLITNIDLEFEPEALKKIVSIACNDDNKIAAWELRQKPYEHPKFYDPISGLTNWNSHACVLLRRSALDQVGYYDETLFMYGEDVELSYRLRQAGFLLRYCPIAVVWHYTYESANQIKPNQFLGSTFANLYLRLKYGNAIDILSTPMMGLRLLLSPIAFPGSNRAVAVNLLRLLSIVPRTLLNRRNSKAYFPFRTWDYELTRYGAFIAQQALPNQLPLVSVITRTHAGRDCYLRQSILSVAHQSYPNIEHIIVEDGGETMQEIVDNLKQVTGKNIKYLAIDKLGRSVAGNTGLDAAEGKLCLFLDDDDLLFAEHIEILVNAILSNPDSVAAYSLALEVTTNVQGAGYVEMNHFISTYFHQDFDYQTLLHHNYMTIQSVLFNRQLYLDRGGFETDMDALEDWVLWKKYAYGNKFHYIPKVTSLFRTPHDPEKIKQRMKYFEAAYPLALSRNHEHIKSTDSLNNIKSS
jgi:GT2 family glycosyltransferase